MPRCSRLSSSGRGRRSLSRDHLATAGRRLLVESRRDRLVLRARVPKNPALIPGVVDGLLLLAQLGRAVRRGAKRERLQPRPHVLALESELLVALVRGGDGGKDRLVRLGVRRPKAERPVWIVRRIRHWQDHVGRLREILPTLAD